MTSVLFGDLVGFTPMAESRDAEEVRELLSAYFDTCRTIIGRYGGTVEKFIGDAVMAVWGVPVAREDDAERAVRAGLELVGAVEAMGEEIGAPGLAMRVGIVTGEVAVTVGATAEGMVAGDAVNTASRVQATAAPGQVWVDDATHALASAAVAFADKGEHALKGKAEPVRLWQARAVVAELRGGQRVDGLEAPLVGRDRELRLIKELFHDTADTGRPSLVVLDGVPGVGKSRLAWEFEKYVDGLTASTYWHRGRCLSYGDGVAFWALAEAVRGRLGLTDASSETHAELGALVDEGVNTYVTDEADRAWLRPRLAVLVGAEGAGSFTREDLFTAWTAFLEAVGSGDPVVWVIDDAQYADEGLLDFIDHLLATSRSPMFVVALARPELLGRRPDLGGRRATALRMDRLSDPSMTELVDGLVDGLPPSMRDQVVERADGIPLFAVETVRALIDRDIVVPSGGRYVPATDAVVDLDAIGAPASLQALVAARLDTLAPAERQVVADASVLGLTFTSDGIAALASDQADLDAVLSSLRRKEIFSVETDRFSAERGQHRFVQGVVRQVAYQTQSRRDRKRRHLAAADHLGGQPDPSGDLAVVIAQHVLDALDASPGADADLPELTRRAVDLLDQAATRARRLGSPAEAQRLLETALAHTDEADLPTRAPLHVAAAEAATAAGAWTEAVRHATQAATDYTTAGDPIAAAGATGTHAWVLTQMGDNRGALDLAEPVWRQLPADRAADHSRLRLVEAMSAAHSNFGNLEAMAAMSDQMLQLSERLGDWAMLARAYTLIGNRLLTVGAPASAGVAYDTAARIARDHDLLDRLAIALNNTVILNAGRDLPTALAAGDEAVATARRAGIRWMIDTASCNLATVWWLSGRLVEARALLAEEWDNLVDPQSFLHACALLGLIAGADGGPGPDLTSTSAETDQEGSLAFQSYLYLVQAMAAGMPEEVPALAEQVLDHLVTWSGLEDDFVHIWPPLVEAALAIGDLELADRLMIPVAQASFRIVAPAITAHHQRLRGLLGAARGEDSDAVEADLRAGAVQLTSLGIVGLGARATEDLATWLATKQRPDEAAELFDDARATYRRLEAHGWLEQLNAKTGVGSPELSESVS